MAIEGDADSDGSEVRDQDSALAPFASSSVRWLARGGRERAHAEPPPNPTGSHASDVRGGPQGGANRPADADLDPTTCATARAEIATWEGYAPTPLIPLPGLAAALGVGAVRYKDEGLRFGLGSFKALGGAYGVLHVLAREVELRTGAPTTLADIRAGAHAATVADMTVVTATDGNHGRSVAWGAQRFGCRAKIYLHEHVSERRADAVRAYGAEVIRVPGTYDDSVAEAARDAARRGWHVVSDTAYPGYLEVPRQVMAGYTTVAAEAAEQMADDPPTHVFVPGGVGGVAAAVFAHLHRDPSVPQAPVCVVVEPELAACLFASAQAGEPRTVPVREETVMAGLSCGEPSLLAWPILDALAEAFVTIPDDLVAPAMRLMADAPFGDPSVVAGESAVAGLVALLAAAQDESLRAALRLDGASRVLLIGTEGATDPVIYRELTGRPAAGIHA